jgi:hypothetical protein
MTSGANSVRNAHAATTSSLAVRGRRRPLRLAPLRSHAMLLRARFIKRQARLVAHIGTAAPAVIQGCGISPPGAARFDRHHAQVHSSLGRRSVSIFKLAVVKHATTAAQGVSLQDSSPGRSNLHHDTLPGR